MKTIHLTIFLVLLAATAGRAQMIEIRESAHKIYEKREAAEATQAAAAADPAAGPAEDGEEEAADTNSDEDLKALANFTFNGVRTVPNLKFLTKTVAIIDTLFVTSRGNRNNPVGMGIYNGFELFGLQDPNRDSADVRINYLIPELSTYGATYTFGACLKNYNKDDEAKGWILGVIFRASFLGKQFKTTYNPDIKEDFITNSVLMHAGGELVFPSTERDKLDLSVYAGYNINKALTNLDKFREGLNTGITRLDYWSTGVRTNFNLTATTDLRFDLGFTLHNNSLRDFTNNADEVIPMIRVGLRQSFFSSPFR
jgi:hypothetical protein